ncbi:hypothetical protein MAR_011475, partial [Mya arenaria]
YKRQQFTTSHEGTTRLDAQIGCAVDGGTIVTDENYWQAKYSPLVKVRKELCGQTYVDYYGSFSFTKSGKNECNWTISVASHVSVNVSVVMGTSLESCRNHNLSAKT